VQDIRADSAIAKLPSGAIAPNDAEMEAVADQLKYLRINPEVCMGVVQKYWGNVSGAIARVKEAI